MAFLSKLIEAHPQVKHHRRTKTVRVVNIPAIIRSIFKALSNRGSVYKATRGVCGPVVAILWIKAVIILAKDKLLIADAMIKASEPGAGFLMPNQIRAIITLGAISSARKVRQRVILDQRHGDGIEQARRVYVAGCRGRSCPLTDEG